MSNETVETLEVLVPRGLLKIRDIMRSSVTAEGLCPIRIGWNESGISLIEIIEEKFPLPRRLLLPRLLEPHAHLDKAFTWNQYCNLSGTYSDALKANLQEHKSRTVFLVRQRVERALKLAIKNGLRAIRSHVDSFGHVADRSWEVYLDLQAKYKREIDLQLVALVPLEYWNTSQGKSLALKVASSGGLLGGVLVPPFSYKASYQALFDLLNIADQLECGVDLHIDEAQIDPAAGLKLLLKVLEHTKKKTRITCSHCTSMGLLPEGALNYLAERLAEHGVKVIALPLTNSWLLGRKKGRTPVHRPIAPIRQLQSAGVTVAVGGDNVQDAWLPVGNLDPLGLIASSLLLAQLAPWERLGLAPFTTAASRVMELTWDGTLKVGGPADFILLDVRSWGEALATRPNRKVLINGKWFSDTALSHEKNDEFDS